MRVKEMVGWSQCTQLQTSTEPVAIKPLFPIAPPKLSEAVVRLVIAVACAASPTCQHLKPHNKQCSHAPCNLPAHPT